MNKPQRNWARALRSSWHWFGNMYQACMVGEFRYAFKECAKVWLWELL